MEWQTGSDYQPVSWNLSGFGANHHLRQILVCLNMPVVQQPEAYLGNIAALLDENGKVKDKELFNSYIHSLMRL